MTRRFEQTLMLGQGKNCESCSIKKYWAHRSCGWPRHSPFSPCVDCKFMDRLMFASGRVLVDDKIKINGIFHYDG